MAAVISGMTPIAPHQDFRYTPVAIMHAPRITLMIRSVFPTLHFIISSYSATFEQVSGNWSRIPIT